MSYMDLAEFLKGERVSLDSREMAYLIQNGFEVAKVLKKNHYIKWISRSRMKILGICNNDDILDICLLALFTRVR